MTRKIVRGCTILLAGFLVAPSLWASTVVLDGTTATHILGLDINGTVYDVTFHYDSYEDLNVGDSFPFTVAFPEDEVEAETARDIIVATLNGSLASSVGPMAAGYASSYFAIPSFFPNSNDVLTYQRGTWIGAGKNYWSDEHVDNGAAGVSADLSYASFSVVPVPATAWLFGSGLFLIGWIRRRSVQDDARL